MKPQNSRPLYVGIKSPLDARRNLLYASKSAVVSIQSQHKIRKINEEKLLLKKKLKNDIKEMRLLLLKLESLLPPEEAEEKSIKIKQKPKEFLKEDDNAEIDKIHAHLEMIEKRLENIRQ